MINMVPEQNILMFILIGSRNIKQDQLMRGFILMTLWVSFVDGCKKITYLTDLVIIWSKNQLTAQFHESMQ